MIGNLTNIAQKVKEAGITKTALTVVGDFLGDEYELSKLYVRHLHTNSDRQKSKPHDFAGGRK